MTKEPLVKEDNFYRSLSLGIEYPSLRGLVFMGYHRRDREEIFQTISQSRERQGIPESFENQCEYAPVSYRLTAKTVHCLKSLYPNLTHDNPIAVNVGAGGDPGATELAMLGFETYAIEIEPNSLFIGRIWDKEFGVSVNRIVCDSSFLPFPDSSVALVYCKEFLHHIRDYERMALEFSRVLCPEGVAVIIEPTLTHRTSTETVRSPDHYMVFNRQYLKAFHDAGLSVERYYVYHTLKSSTWKQVLASRFYEIFNRQFENATGTRNSINGWIQRIIDGQNIWFLRKSMQIPVEHPLDDIEILDPERLTMDESVFEDKWLKKSIELYGRIRREVIGK